MRTRADSTSPVVLSPRGVRVKEWGGLGGPKYLGRPLWGCQSFVFVSLQGAPDLSRDGTRG